VIPLDEARSIVLTACPPAPPVPSASRDALGCVLAAPVVATEAVPPFANTSVDGYAVRAADTATVPAVLRVVDELRAGQAPEREVGSGEAIRIMTGAPMPGGADAVVMVEDTERRGDDGVEVRVAVEAGSSVRPAGDDVVPGDVVVPAGTVLRAAHLGVLASVGQYEVTVYPPLRVGVLSTGDELVTDDRPLRPGEIREANKDMLLALVEQAGAIPVDLGVVRDDEVALNVALEDAVADCDALISSGGVSMGDYDLVKVVLDKLGAMQWMQVAIKPAKPFAFGLLGPDDHRVPVFGLPGNPVSSMVSFELLARPALRQMMGHTELFRPRVVAIADEALRRRPGDGKVHWLRVQARFGDDGRVHVRSTGAQGSHQLAASAQANGLASLADGPGVEAGGDVDVSLLGAW
jgi:molybdenum cofactor synthesis domain-containing protein